MIDLLAETGSTNADLAAAIGDGGWAEGRWRVAARQRAGRGRLGRRWADGAGNFMGSTAVALPPEDPPAPSLALVAGLAVYAAVAPFIPPPARATLKWPNDVMIGAAKLAGVLLERVGAYVIVGVGVNLAQAPDLPDRPTIALAAFGSPPTVADFATILATAFAAELARWRCDRVAGTVARWQQAAHPLGTPLRADGVAGSFAGLDATGALRLRLADASLRTIHAGDVALA